MRAGLRASDPALAPPLQAWGTVDDEDRQLARAAGAGMTPLKLAVGIIGGGDAVFLCYG